MTRTIYKNQNKTINNGVSVDIYADYGNREKYCFTSYCKKFTQDDLSNWVKDSVDFENSELVTELQEIIKCFSEAANNGFNYIWYCSSTNGNDDHLEFFALKEDAINNITSQTC